MLTIHQELRSALRSLNLNHQEVENIMKLGDGDKDGVIDFKGASAVGITYNFEEIVSFIN